ncbi:MAG: 3-isopropylmalate dehydratase small subunit [Limnochordaceae bacterium]|nr:3-isopropylmalate dehydratase small subunit [Limnochordaceae bacterium]
MRPFRVETGLVAPLDRANIDTDQIIPKQFLKRIQRTGFGEVLFYDWRYEPDGRPRPDFVLNQEPWKQASILLARNNFGCGSSREHAPWALADFGFRAIIAPSFADIFYNNCFQNGLLPVVLTEAQVDELFGKVRDAGKAGYWLTVDLERQEVRDESGWQVHFDVDPFRRQALLLGQDDIDRTLQYAAQIEQYEQAHPRPWL